METKKPAVAWLKAHNHADLAAEMEALNPPPPKGVAPTDGQPAHGANVYTPINKEFVSIMAKALPGH